MGFVNLTVSISYARVHLLALHSALKKAFAAFTGYDTVVQAGRFVITDHANHWLIVIIDHPVGGLTVVLVEESSGGLSLGRQLANVALPQFGHIDMVPLF